MKFIQWQQTWQELSGAATQSPIQLYDELIASYSQPHRYYHNQQHLAECLEKLAELRDLATYPAEIEFALWFHDAIYDPLRHDNERLSADWGRTSALNAGFGRAIADRIYYLVMATQSHAKPEDNDTKILIDVDLAILGANAERYSEYEQQIRREYAHVPDEIFRGKRTEILRKFLVKPAIFNTKVFIERYEQQARSNIKFAMEVLCQI